MAKSTPILLPDEFVKYLDKIMMKKEFGFQSREEVVKAAIRDYFDKIIGKWYDFGLQNDNLVPRVQNKDKPIKTESKPIKKEANKVPNPPATQIQKPNSSSAGKLLVTDKMKMEFKSKMVQIIKQQKQFPLLLLELKNMVSKACAITQGTKPYIGKFAEYVQSIIDEYKLPVAIEPPNLVKKN